MPGRTRKYGCRVGLLGPLLGLVLFAMTIPDNPLPAEAQARTTPPPARQDNLREVLHGVEIADPYRWLEDKDSPETRAWIDAQNRYTDSYLQRAPGREKIKQRLTQLMKIEWIGMPIPRGRFYFYARRPADKDQAAIYRRRGLRGKEELLVDPLAMSEDKTTSVNIMDISEDGKILAYGVRQGGEDEVSVRFLDVETRRERPDCLPRARYGSLSIKPDNSGFYYSRYEKEGPRVYYHAMGADPEKDKLLFGKGYGAGTGIGCGLSEDGRFLLLTVYHGSAAKKTEIYVQHVAAKGPIIPIVNDVEARFDGGIAEDRLYLHTNWNAPNGRILRVDLMNPKREAWREIVPNGPAVIQGFSLAGGKLFVEYMQDVRSRLSLHDPNGKPLGDIPLPMIGTVSGAVGRWKDRGVFFAFTSFPIPLTIYRYDVEKKTRSIWARQHVPVPSGKMEVKQVWYASKDGTRIPMFLVHAKGLKPDGARPTYLTGYGGFNLSMTPAFSQTATLWAEHGGVYALPNLRGGGEFGEAWHEAGMLAKKQNVFDDFLAAAEWLIRNGYTNPSKLAIAGGSNGGLLVGAALTQRPALFRAAICAVPLLDMVRYHQFLIARFWVPEYGSSEDPEQFKYLYAYSPYHRAKKGEKYPAVLFVTGDSDTRVDPLHARKMTALLQSMSGSDRPILLKYDTKAGHVSGLPVTRQIEDNTDILSFLFWQLGME